MPLIPVAEWLPDQAPYQSPGSPNVKNVIPSALSYRPFKAFATYSTNALGARARGLWYGRAVDGSSRVFAGSATDLYTLSGTTWNEVTRSSGGDYAVGDESMWSMVQFGDTLIAVNGTDAPQAFTLSNAIDGSAKFAALSGSPPTGEFVTVVGDFVVMGKIAAAKNRVQWSGINNAASWATSATTMADQQDMPDGGNVRGLCGGVFGVVLQEDCIRRMDFIGPPEIFKFTLIARNVGASIEGSIAEHANRVFFMHRTGPYMLVNGSELVPIGTQKVTRTFWEAVDQTYLHRVTATIDPGNKLYLLSFPGPDASAGTPDTVWAYEWEVGRWSPIEPGNHEMISSGSQQNSITIDDADDYADDIDAAGAPSLDSEVYSGSIVPLLAAFNTSHELMFANGANLEATVDTAEMQLTPGRRTFIRSARPVVDGSSTTVTLAIGYRDNATDTLTWTIAATPESSTGLCNFRNKARYQRGRIVVEAGDTWTHIQGIDDLTVSAQGWR